MPRAEPRTPAPPPGEPFDWFIRIPNRLEMVRSVRALLSATCEAHEVDEESTQEILLAVSEIMNNSIEHVAGRGNSGYHEVDLRFGIAGGQAVGCVVDEGEGGIDQNDFDGAAAPTLDNDRGRGLLLIREYVDDLRVTPIPGVGTEIRFVKRLRGGGGKA